MDDLALTSSLPIRSRLTSPHPVGIGTGMVESLASYLARIADVHLVSVPHLMSYLASWTTDGRPTKNHRIYNLMRLRSRELNGMQQIAQRWGVLVSAQTCRAGIDQLTLLPWRYVVTPRALTHISQYWCPHCLDERREAGQALYWPLLWSLRSVIICPLHQIPLEQRCHRCHALVPSLTANGWIGNCPKCKAWLGFEGRTGFDECAGKDVVDVSVNAVELARGAFAMLTTSPLLQEQMETGKLVGILDYCLQAANCRQTLLAQRLDLSPATLNQLLSRRNLVDVPTLLKLLACFGVTIADFVQKPIAILVSSDQLTNFIGSLPDKRKSTVQSKLKPSQRATSELLVEVQSTLEAALLEDNPPGLPTLARRMGLTTVKVPWHHYPHLCRAIIEKRKARFNLDVARQGLAEIMNLAETPPPLKTIASHLKTSPVTLRRFFPDEVAAIKAQRRIIRNVAALRHNVEAFLIVEPPLSLSEVSRRLGVKTHHIRQYCPELRQAIIRRFAIYRRTCAAERKRTSIAAVRNAVAKLNDEGQFPTKSKVAAVLGRTQRLILTKSEREAFSETMHELGLWQR